ncbi:class I SAM-dependent methyltransferase [Bacillus suaedae]|uniref:Class I SAM-dependent methyltransferase n=1 Tax=Halalkalibacter suaedae TaxID=2822140 RepID=A0A940WZT4_9BACI|nr:class I SAM-dependent methyltransferase [Bacillus suaedae]
MNEMDYKSFYEKVGKTNGWDFSKLKVRLEGALWDFNEEIKNKSRTSDILLDIGTGGGENLLTIASSFLFLSGIDLSYEMIESAQTNLKRAGISNVRFSQMSSDKLEFPAGFFDVVTCRHAPFSSMEVAKVLKKGGYFLTQQVGERDKVNLKRAFKRGQVSQKNEALLARYVKELEELSFSKVQHFEYDATEYYQRTEDLIFLLKHAPIIPNFGEEVNDFELLADFIKENSTEKGIRTNSNRFLIIARK